MYAFKKILIVMGLFILVSCSAQLAPVPGGEGGGEEDAGEEESSSLDTSSIRDGSADILDFISANGYSLTWDEDFEGNALDTSVWKRETDVRNNNEIQTYVDAPFVTQVEDSVLDIVAFKSPNDGKWYSGRIITSGKLHFRYGYIEAKIKLPTGSGMWPAFWLLGCYDSGGISWPYTGEFDIMEYSPSNPYYGDNADGSDRLIYKAYSTLHTQTNHGTGLPLGEYDYGSEEGATGDWHRYGMLWCDDFIEVYYDGKFIGRQEKPVCADAARWPFDRFDAFVLLNLAIGGDLGGNVPADAKRYDYMIDYVKLYQREGDSLKRF